LYVLLGLARLLEEEGDDFVLLEYLGDVEGHLVLAEEALVLDGLEGLGDGELLDVEQKHALQVNLV